MSDLNYSFLDRLLHRIALQFSSIAEVSFDLDQQMVQIDPKKIISQRHVFVSGLARAGTTVLMRRFYATGLFRSLTYRDMPFVLAPNLWRRLSLISKKQIEYAERAHGDNLLINVDSPESFDEVFWRVFAGNQYLKNGYLVPHTPSTELVHKYVRYINSILSAHSPRRERYLSKNNNNILRLGAIHQAFPKALIFIPFRDPVQHAFSLLQQHHLFSKLQEKSKFTFAYMTWLGHHEFGLAHRPFKFDNIAQSPCSIDKLNYWLQLWCQAYGWLEQSKPKEAVFVCYEDLCSNKVYWDRLATLAGIDIAHNAGDSFKSSNKPIDIDFDQCLADHASVLYARLVAQTRAQLF